jgi:hypothetical protein
MSLEFPESYRQFLENLADYPWSRVDHSGLAGEFRSGQSNGFQKSYGQTPS